VEDKEMFKTKLYIVLAALAFLFGCSAPIYYSQSPGLSISIVNPIAKSISMSHSPSNARFIANSSGQVILVTISGPGIIIPFSTQATANGDGTYNASLKNPSGVDRTILVQAFDASGSIYASVSKTLDLSDEMPAITLQLQPDNQSSIETSQGSPGFVMEPGKISVYKRSITQTVDFPYSYYYFGIYLIVDGQSAPFDGNDYFSIIDGQGNVIMPAATLNSAYPTYFSYWIGSPTPYEGTFYLMLWGNTSRTGTISEFPVVNQG